MIKKIMMSGNGDPPQKTTVPVPTTDPTPPTA